MKHLLWALVLPVLLLLAACGNNDAPSPGPSRSGPDSSAPAASPSLEPGSSLPPSTASSPVSSPASLNCAPIKGGGDTFLVLTAVRVGTHAGYDRVTFEFKQPAQPPGSPAAAGTLPRYELARVTSVTEDGSGNPVEISGKDLYQIVFQGASGVDMTTDAAVITYAGPKQFKPNFKLLAEVERTGDFEATLSWALGLKQTRCLKVVELGNPTRLAIDIPHQM